MIQVFNQVLLHILLYAKIIILKKNKLEFHRLFMIIYSSLAICVKKRPGMENCLCFQFFRQPIYHLQIEFSECFVNIKFLICIYSSKRDIFSL